ncbi:hypothetical protein OIU85_014919 [Salix viminalis]|uniref:Uncharacterized protein n=1 Tax=Salix viminalis TaxID=40686 RepID=A0A9Q0SBQ6_SALVM|nr:hypothetical protein OIU85_014919 [Salix viminalis]
MAILLVNLVQSIKSKVRALKKSKKPYIKMDKSSSVKVEIRSRKARKLIDKTLRVADHPGKRTGAFFCVPSDSVFSQKFKTFEGGEPFRVWPDVGMFCSM